MDFTPVTAGVCVCVCVCLEVGREEIRVESDNEAATSTEHSDAKG